MTCVTITNKRRVETVVQALLASVDGTPLRKVRPCDTHEIENSLNLRKARGLDCIPNECLRHLPRRPHILVPLAAPTTQSSSHHCKVSSITIKESHSIQFLDIAQGNNVITFYTF
jgi:hypothetical protein